jgi:hypothetical protein
LNTGSTRCTDVANALSFWPGGLVVGNEKGRWPSFAGDEDTPPEQSTCYMKGSACARSHGGYGGGRPEVKSSQVSTLPKAKSKTRSKQNKHMHK